MLIEKMPKLKKRLRAGLKKYRSTIVMATFLLLNVAESAYYGTPFLTVNEQAQSLGEMFWDNTCSMGIFFAGFMAIYDLIHANAQFLYAVKMAPEEERDTYEKAGNR